MRIRKALAFAAAVVALAVPVVAQGAVVQSINHGGSYDTATRTITVSPGLAGLNATVYVVDSACTPVNGGGYSGSNCASQHAVSQVGLTVGVDGTAVASGVPTCGAIIQWDVYGGAEQRSLAGNGNHDFRQGALYVLPACKVVAPRGKLEVCGDPGVHAYFDNSRSNVSQTFQLIYRHKGTFRTFQRTIAGGNTLITPLFAVDRNTQATVRIKNSTVFQHAFVAPLPYEYPAC